MELPLSSLTEFLQELIQSAIRTDCCSRRRLALSKLVASIINKWANGKSLKVQIDASFFRIYAFFFLVIDQMVNCIKIILNDSLIPILLNNDDHDTEKKRSIFVILVWVSKKKMRLFL